MTALPPAPHSRWSVAEIDTLRSMAGKGAEAADIGEYLGRSALAVTRFAARQGIRVAGPHWSPPEVIAPDIRSLDPPRQVQPRRDRVAECVASMRERGATDQAIAASLRLTASQAAGYGLRVRQDVADPFGMDRRIGR